MAEVIQLARHRLARVAADTAAIVPTTVFFDLASPDTYLVAERLERCLGDARWQAAVIGSGIMGVGSELAPTIAAAERRAHELHMPLVWPERFPTPVPTAMRVATHAAEHGCGAAFAIAAGRLAFCGGFDIEDPHILAEAAAAAGVELADALAAARDPRRDHLIATAGRELRLDGGAVLPALRCEGRLYCGEQRVTAAMLARPVRTAPPSAC
jgi:2-hydroxychromene-2-carboxylate isomerase